MQNIVYKITSPNNKVYIGRTTKTLKQRANNGNGYVGNKIFFADIQLFGWSQFKTEVILTTEDIWEAKRIEREEIFNHDSTSFIKGYNNSKGDRNESEKELKDLKEILKNTSYDGEAVSIERQVLLEKILRLNKIYDNKTLSVAFLQYIMECLLKKFEVCDLKRILEEQRKVDAIAKQVDEHEILLFLAAEKMLFEKYRNGYNDITSEERNVFLKEKINMLRNSFYNEVDIPKTYKIQLV